MSETIRLRKALESHREAVRKGFETTCADATETAPSHFHADGGQSSLTECEYTMSALAKSCFHSVPQTCAINCIGIDWGKRRKYWLGMAMVCTTVAEHRRAALFRKPDDALRHLLGRALARGLLKSCHPLLPLPGQLPCNPWGKPHSPTATPYFSITHAGSQVWLAWSETAAVGIDLESSSVESRSMDLLDLLGSLHPNETAAILNFADELQVSAFLRCWCRKEAVIKAMGMGLSVPLESFEVSSQPMTRDWLRQPSLGQSTDWTCFDIALPSYQLSVAAMAPSLALAYELVD